MIGQERGATGVQRNDWNGWLVASVILGASFWLVAVAEHHGPIMVAWKGAGVALLAANALVFATANPSARRDASMLAIVMAFGAGGDMAIERSLTAGAGLFLAGHGVAVALYLSNRRAAIGAADFALAIAVLLVVPAVAWSLPGDRAAAATIAFYATGLAAMAAAAWLSRFPRERVAAGALLFVASDLLIFARMGPLAGSVIPRLLVWPLYYAGQFLICTGVLAGLNRRSAA